MSEKENLILSTITGNKKNSIKQKIIILHKKASLTLQNITVTDNLVKKEYDNLSKSSKKISDLPKKILEDALNVCDEIENENQEKFNNQKNLIFKMNENIKKIKNVNDDMFKEILGMQKKLMDLEMRIGIVSPVDIV